MSNSKKRFMALLLAGFCVVGMNTFSMQAKSNSDRNDSTTSKNESCTNPGEAAPGTTLDGSNGGPTHGDFNTGAGDEIQDNSSAEKHETGSIKKDTDGDDADGEEHNESLISRGNLGIEAACAGYTDIDEMDPLDAKILSQISNLNPGNKVCGISKGFFTVISGNTKPDIEKYTWTAWLKKNETDRADFSYANGNYHGFGQEMIAVWKPYESEIRALNDGKFPENRAYIYPADTTDGKLSFWVHKAGYYDVLGDPFYKQINLKGYQTFTYIVNDVVEEADAAICGTHTVSHTWCNSTTNAAGEAVKDCHTTYEEVANVCPINYYYEETQSIQVADATVAENMYASEIGRLPNFGMEAGAESLCLDNLQMFENAKAENGSNAYYPPIYKDRGSNQFCVRFNGDYDYKYTHDGTKGSMNVYQNLQIKDGFYTNMANGYACIPNEDGNCIVVEYPESENGGNGSGGHEACEGDDCGEEGTEITELLPPSIEIELDIEKGNPQRQMQNVKKFVHLNKNVKNRLQFDYYRDKAKRTESKNN